MTKILELGNIFARDVVFGSTTGFSLKKGLVINKTELERIILQDKRIRSVDVDLAKPGESVMAVCVKDIVPIRKKIHGKCGEGRTHDLKNVVVATLGQIIAAQEGLLPMESPGADYTPFSKMINVCLDISVKKGVVEYEHEEALRLAGLRAAQYLGETLLFIDADEVEVFEFNPSAVDASLPRAVYNYTLLAQDLLHHNHVGGHDVNEKGLMPFIVENPLELLDGLIVSGNCVSACDKTTTWHHWNNCIARDLFFRTESELNFVGVVLSSLLTNMEEKENMAAKAVELALSLKPDIGIITKEGFGNPDADIMIIIELLEKAGVKTVSIHNEYAGERGVSNPLADFTKYADAIVSVGNSNELITLPAPAKFIGPYEKLTILSGARDNSISEDGIITVQLQAILGATNQLGNLGLTCEEV